MKKTITTTLLLIFCISLFAQEEVTFNFSRDRAPFGSMVSLNISINGVIVAKVGNGATVTYKTMLDITKPITVVSQVRSSKLKGEITFTLLPGNKVDIKTGFESRDIVIELISGGVLTGGDTFVADLKNLTPIERSETIRQQWISKGGRLFNESMVVSGTYISLKESGMKMTGGGLQLSYNFSVLNLKVPEFKPGRQTWNSLVYGLGINMQYYGSTISIAGMKSIGMFNMNYAFSLNGGYTIGTGKFLDETLWKGVAFELTYKPSLIMSIVIPEGGDSETSFNLNMMGVGFDINFNSFTANAKKLAPKSKSKLSFFILPPVKDMPLIVNIGYGRTFYRKPY